MEDIDVPMDSEGYEQDEHANDLEGRP